MKKGKVSVPVYIYLVPKKKWPKDNGVTTTHWYGGRINIDFRDNNLEMLGVEILDAFSVEIDGKEVKVSGNK